MSLRWNEKRTFYKQTFYTFYIKQHKIALKEKLKMHWSRRLQLSTILVEARCLDFNRGLRCVNRLPSWLLLLCGTTYCSALWKSMSVILGWLAWYIGWKVKQLEIIGRAHNETSKSDYDLWNCLWRQTCRWSRMCLEQKRKSFTNVSHALHTCVFLITLRKRVILQFMIDVEWDSKHQRPRNDRKLDLTNIDRLIASPKIIVLII